MKAVGLFLVVLLPSFVLTPLGQNVTRNGKVNASAFEFEVFRKDFHRRYKFNSPQFNRRLFLFQVGRRKATLGSCFANTLLCLRSGVSPPLFNGHVISLSRI